MRVVKDIERPVCTFSTVLENLTCSQMVIVLLLMMPVAKESQSVVGWDEMSGTRCGRVKASDHE